MTVILRGIFIVSLVNRCDVALSFFSFSFFLRLDSSSVDRSIDRSSLFHRQGLDKDERDVTYIAIISPHRDAIESRLLLFRRSNPLHLLCVQPLRVGLPPLHKLQKKGGIPPSKIRWPAAWPATQNGRERERERGREREKRRGSRLKTNTLLRERGRAGGESPAVRFLRVTSRSRLNNTR